MILLRSEFVDKISNIINYRKQVNIILELKKVKTSDGIISAEYDPVNSGDLGSVSINIESSEVVKSTISLLDAKVWILMQKRLTDQLWKNIISNQSIDDDNI